MNKSNVADVSATIKTLLRQLGSDPNAEGLRQTPERVARAWLEMLSGYGDDPKKILGTTFDGEDCDEIIICRNIQFFSTCEHHLLPIEGKAHIGYLPNPKTMRVVGISKLPRLVECFARRLQIQERMTREIADAFMEAVQPRGVAVVVEASHFCMRSRGVEQPCADMVTSRMLGEFRSDDALKSEFFNLLGMRHA